jgi:hypothetical protein
MFPPSMKVVQFKGMSGIMVLVAAFLLGFLGLVLFPSAFVQVLWNAIIFEGFLGPEINLGQGALLWSAIIMLAMVVFQPEFSFQVVKDKAPAKDAMPRHEDETATSQAEPPSVLPKDE